MSSNGDGWLDLEREAQIEIMHSILLCVGQGKKKRTRPGYLAILQCYPPNSVQCRAASNLKYTSSLSTLLPHFAPSLY